MWYVIETDPYRRHEKIVLETESENDALDYAFDQNSKQPPEGVTFIVVMR